ncbi:hypothetical protein FH972_016712 [Carpinus fangiana]|uniref:Uncharacterized protein n=1 Tax=Carpinus fangiana TaxID=176857 RepID=A0A5N6RH79_9ROSI|nr:hypothetical protein FH972_016712 [Carpinus fangiana]
MEPQHIVSIDEHHSRKVIRIEGQPTITREERFKRLTEAGDRTRAAEPAKIQKVIFLLRDHKHFVKYFEPRVAAVGPIHHGNPKYRLGEEYKLVLASKFVERSGKDIKRLYEEAEMEIKQLRRCFEEEVTKNYDDEALAWMLFVDGCAILQYIFCAANNKFEELNIKIDSVAFAQQDLFLLENQVPYCLLKLLMNLSGKEVELSESIERFIGSVTYQETKPQQKQGESFCSQPKQPTHLLDLLRTTLLGNKVQKEQESKASNPPESSKSDSPSGKTRGIWPCRKKGEEDPDWQSYRNVQELKSAGIQLKRSKHRSLRNVSFTRRFNFYPGYLWLPPIIVDDSTGPKFMNLIAYEMCLDFKNDFGISSYISFLDSLIDEVNDVKDLRKAHVLHNFLGSDQEVADLFNEIGTDVVPNTDAYKDVKGQIQEYYEIPYMTWLAQVYHNHFSSPWTVLAFLGVLLGLGLTAAQTAYAVMASHLGPCEKFCMLKLKET